MLDIKLFRETPEVVKADLKKRNDPVKLKWVDEVIKKDKEWRALKLNSEKLRHKRNLLTEKIRELKKQGKPASSEIKQAAEIPQKIKQAEEQQEKLAKEIKTYLMRLPNISHKTVPVGKDETENKQIKTFGTKTKFSFEPRSHVDLIKQLDIADTEKAAEVSGARFYYLKNELVQLDFALIKFALDYLHKKNYILIEPPFMIKRKPYEGVTDLADFEDMLYKIENEDLYLIATSEHAIGAYHMNEIIDEKKLPLKYAGISPCFRKEAGSHGKDTKGIFRVHQFNKIEQFIFCKPEDSWKHHEELLKNAEVIYQKLKLPYRVVNICTGDLGTIASKKYDIELWMPVQKTYREVVSCSNCTDYQARRLNIKYGKERNFVHTLNSTAIATGRTIVGILENYQQKDGSVKIPTVLHPYMNGIKKITHK